MVWCPSRNLSCWNTPKKKDAVWLSRAVHLVCPETTSAGRTSLVDEPGLLVVLP